MEKRTGLNTIKPKSYDPELLLQALEDVCKRMGVEVRYEDFSRDEIRPASGRCRLMGRDVVLVDRALGPQGRLQALTSCMGEMDLEGVFLPPAVREMMETT